MSYTHLTTAERIEIHKLCATGKLSIAAIANIIGRAKSTISRELKRNIDKTYKIYLPDTAQGMMKDRRAKAKVRFNNVGEGIITEIKEHLEQYHSPEQLAGRMKREGRKHVSYETIYQMIYADYGGLGSYKQYLRQKQKQRRRKGAKQSRIPNRIGIEHRPAVADLKRDIGHWESDTMIGKGHRGVVVTHVDKASKFLLAGLSKDKTMKEVNAVTMNLFQNVEAEYRQSMTFDNGREFCGHQELSEGLKIDCYLANPYHSWERGLNEHTNGLIRQFYPKTTNFTLVKEDEFQEVVNLINHRPRKSLNYQTPFEVFYAKSKSAVKQI
jgi:transposase, IS30 family